MTKILLRGNLTLRIAEYRERNYLVLEDISEPLSHPILKGCSSALIISVCRSQLLSMHRAGWKSPLASDGWVMMGNYLNFAIPCLRRLSIQCDREALSK